MELQSRIPGCRNSRKHGTKCRRPGHGTAILLAREARWNGRAGSSGCPAGCKDCDFGDGSLLPFVPFSYGVSAASPIAVRSVMMVMGDSGVLNRENPAQFTE